MVGGHGAARSVRWRLDVAVAGGLGDQAGLIEQFVALQHAALVPAMRRGGREQGVDAGLAARIALGPAGEAGEQGGEAVRGAAATVLPAFTSGLGMAAGIAIPPAPIASAAATIIIVIA